MLLPHAGNGHPFGPSAALKAEVGLDFTGLFTGMADRSRIKFSQFSGFHFRHQPVLAERALEILFFMVQDGQPIMNQQRPFGLFQASPHQPFEPFERPFRVFLRPLHVGGQVGRFQRDRIVQTVIAFP